MWCRVVIRYSFNLRSNTSSFWNNQTIKTPTFKGLGWWFFVPVLCLTELTRSQRSRDISERSDHCLFRVGISLCSCRRSLHDVGPRPEKPHLEVLLWGQRSMLLNLSDNIHTETENTGCNERNFVFTGTKENGAFNCYITFSVCWFFQ